MTTYRMDGHLTMKFAKREEPEGADKINGAILVRHNHGPSIELRDPTNGKWYLFKNALIALDGFLYLDGEEPLPTYAEEMTISTPTPTTTGDGSV